MTQEHTITPPPELMRKWVGSQHGYLNAARWGADQELEACCEWVSQFNYDDYSYGDRLRAARRSPKPPSLKEQALKMLDDVERFTEGDYYIIRRAIESLPA